MSWRGAASNARKCCNSAAVWQPGAFTAGFQQPVISVTPQRPLVRGRAETVQQRRHLQLPGKLAGRLQQLRSLPVIPIRAAFRKDRAQRSAAVGKRRQSPDPFGQADGGLQMRDRAIRHPQPVCQQPQEVRRGTVHGIRAPPHTTRRSAYGKTASYSCAAAARLPTSAATADRSVIAPSQRGSEAARACGSNRCSPAAASARRPSAMSIRGRPVPDDRRQLALIEPGKLRVTAHPKRASRRRGHDRGRSQRQPALRRAQVPPAHRRPRRQHRR